MDDRQLVSDRAKSLWKLISKNTALVSYVLLAFIVYIAVRIRTLNLDKLRDISTGGWTLGPDLDPFLFLRWAKEIAVTGTISAIDYMRYVPIGLDTKAELFLHSYMIYWFHKLAQLFGSTSLDQSAAIYPAFMFALTVIAFYFMTYKIFEDFLGKKQSRVIALLSSLFLSIMPPLLARTISGIPEKESAAFLFMFLAFYFFIFAWKSNSTKKSLTLALLSGISTAIMALIWGGYTFVFVTIGVSTLVAFLAGKVENRHLGIYVTWILTGSVISVLFSNRYTFQGMMVSITTGVAFLTLFVLIVDFIIRKYNLAGKISYFKLNNTPVQFRSLILALVLGAILVSILFGPLFIFDKLGSIKTNLITTSTDRLSLTVAENRQPYFAEWANNFGPIINGIPLFFWIFISGSVYLFYRMMFMIDKKDRWVLVGSYIFFLLALIFSRYAENSTFNGTNFVSVSFYILGVLALVGTAGYFYIRYYQRERRNIMSKIDFGLILIFILFFLNIIGARGAVRLVMVLVPSSAIIASFFLVSTLERAINLKSDTKKAIYAIIALILLISSAYSGYYFYNVTKGTAENFAPSIYTNQWQLAMSWVRENTSEDAVFGHWWDYGYWVQSIGNRATVLDGGNYYPYWNHMMGRYALTGPSNEKALEFLYAHNTTHFLIDSTDIGKYGAFSSIGSDETLDRVSYIPTIPRNDAATQDKKNSTVQVYDAGNGIGLDEDIIYEINGSTIFIPRGKSALRAIFVERDLITGELVSAPEALFLTQKSPTSNLEQYRIKLRYIYDNGELKDFEEGINAGIFLVPAVQQTSQGITIANNGGAVYLSNRTVMSQLARLYFYDNEEEFKLVHVEDDVVVKEVNAQANTGSNFIYYQGSLRGPIKIWEISYPEDIEFKQEYLEIEYPENIR